MQAFEVNWLRGLAVMLVTGITLAVFLYLGFGLAARPSTGRPVEEERERFPADIEVARRSVPAILILVYLVMLIFLIAYALTASERIRP